MEIPVGKTYFAHAIFALWVLTIAALDLFMKTSLAESGSAQALGMIVGMFAVIPAGLIAAYSVITVIVTLLRRQRVPRDMLLLPAGFVVGIIGGTMIASIETRLWTVVAYLLYASYVIMTLALVVRYQWVRRRRAES